jgi:hypothetical protein
MSADAPTAHVDDRSSRDPLRSRVSRRNPHRDRGADPVSPDAARTNRRAPIVPALDAMDRAQLGPMDALHVAEADATIVDLANRLERRPADVRRATGRLVARGLLRRRAESAVSWGLVFTPTASGLDLLDRVGLPFASAGDRDRRRPDP